MKCPACGAENDPANRFCDQCGSRLEQPAAAPDPAVATQQAAMPACPSCGSVVLPGEAFCDNCGASLAGLAPTPVESPAAPASPAPDDGGIAPTAVPMPAVDAGDVAPIPPAGDEPTPVPPPGGDVVPNTPDPAVDAEPAPAPATDEAAMAPATSEPAPAVPATDGAPVVAPTDETVLASAPPVLPAPAAPAADTQADFTAKRQALEEQVARQQQVLAQLEGVQSMLGAGTPAGVLQSLDEARAALQKSQDELAALQPPAPAVDPAVVAALNDEIARQQQVLAQLEGVQSMLGAGTPAGVLQSLDEARAALQKSQDELAALGISPAPAPAPADANAPTMVAPVGAAAAPAAPAAPDAATPAPAAAPAPTGPRLVLEENGKELPLPAGKSEIIIGREDPISGIHPEIDMTPYGGETGGVSRQHARLNLSGGQWTLTDLNSTNHTKIDGNRLEPNVPTPVQDGARLQFGRVALVFRLS